MLHVRVQRRGVHADDVMVIREFAGGGAEAEVGGAWDFDVVLRGVDVEAFLPRFAWFVLQIEG